MCDFEIYTVIYRYVFSINIWKERERERDSLVPDLDERTLSGFAMTRAMTGLWTAETSPNKDPA